MPSRASYEVKIEGIIDGPPSATKGLTSDFQKVFPELPPASGSGELGSGEPWPAGFVLRDYKACLWKSRGYAYNANQTLLSFRAEVSLFVDEALYEARVQSRLLRDVEWFYKYREHKWYEDLLGKMKQLEKDLEKVTLEKVRFREWKWYCGNGGGT